MHMHLDHKETKHMMIGSNENYKIKWPNKYLYDLTQGTRILQRLKWLFAARLSTIPRSAPPISCSSLSPDFGAVGSRKQSKRLLSKGQQRIPALAISITWCKPSSMINLTNISYTSRKLTSKKFWLFQSSYFIELQVTRQLTFFLSFFFLLSISL